MNVEWNNLLDGASGRLSFIFFSCFGSINVRNRLLVRRIGCNSSCLDFLEVFTLIDIWCVVGSGEDHYFFVMRHKGHRLEYKPKHLCSANPYSNNIQHQYHFGCIWLFYENRMGVIFLSNTSYPCIPPFYHF